MPDPVDVEAAALPLRLRGKPLQTAYDVVAYLGVRHGRLIRLLYNSPESSRYTEFEIPKRTGGMRSIHSPIGLLRELQSKLKDDFSALYRAHPHAHGFIPERSVVTNAREHVGKRWVLNIDLEDFFPSVNFGRVRGLFMKPPFDMGPPAATICAKIVTHRNGLPQGAPTSPVLSNLIASALDRRLLRLARQNRATYSRYADDITFSTNLPVFPPALATRTAISGGIFKVEAGDALIQAVTASGFSVNASKVRIHGQSDRQNVTGLSVNARVNVPRKRIRKIRAMLHAWRKFGLEDAANEHFTKYRSRAQHNQAPRSEQGFRNIVYGHLSFIKMVRGADDPLFLKLCSQVLELDPNPSSFLRQMVFGFDDFEVFISHASEDKLGIARPIYEACERQGLKAFLDEEHIGWGQSFTSRINVALGAARTVLVVISQNSVSKEWPLAEINTALALEISGAKRVIPLMVGHPDLSKLPLIRTKRWITWTGDPDLVAAELKQVLRAGNGAETQQHEHLEVTETGPDTSDRRSAVDPIDRSAQSETSRAGLFTRLFKREKKMDRE
ncbi:MAG: TIR domain-containing protein [Pseudomonadota bacterium]